MSGLSLLRLTLAKAPSHAAALSALRGFSTLGRAALPASSLLANLKTATCTVSHPTIAASSPSDLTTTIQLRTKVTKAKKHKRAKIQERERRVARGLSPKPKPPKYIPKTTPVINAMTREERNAESAAFDQAASQEMKVKIEKQKESEFIALKEFTKILKDDTL